MGKLTLPLLDSSLYPQFWQQQTFTNPQALLMAMLIADITPDANFFTRQLLANEVYQDWINSSVFGRYLQRNFTAFSQQTEDSFNIDMPSLFRQELMRHAQYLPLEQILFFVGDLPKSVRQTKVLSTTVNPATVIINAQKVSAKATMNNPTMIINQIVIRGKQVLGFPIRHNKRTSERLRNEVLILDFQELRLVNEMNIKGKKRSNIEESILLRSYELR
ncbi:MULTISPECIES: hypothetical protein [unclassified Psychrobacter]|uniref:hypothetical protein n=1 Tax=unclassified Psychrobacter TaxID=196806 RepID=UPI000EDF3E12|nr:MULTISPECIES: hypothetical protein [unclassified Psychrobacter]MBE8610788.1 hypothetical protein [Pseudomonas lundensis]HCI76845.1 hypothetical protein [Psychrobacter sp.]